MFSRREVKEKGKLSFKKYYWPSVAAALVMGAGVASGSGGGSGSHSNSSGQEGSSVIDTISQNPALFATIIGGVIIAVLISIIFGMLVKAFVFNNIIVGCSKFFIDIQKDVSNLTAIVSTFKQGKYFNVVITMFLKDLYVALWSLLFIIPGIVKRYEYRMIQYILAENPEMDRKEAFELSKEMMTGNKWAAFVYDLSFIGWAWLTIITCGIVGVFYLAPYKASADAVLYETLKGNTTPDIVASVEY